MINQDLLKSYVAGLGDAVEIFDDKKPDLIIAPMMGSVPFVDIMNLIDPNFDNEKVHYMPASSSVVNIQKVMRGWLSNFLDDNVHPDHDFYLMGIDEVVSGNSTKRVYKAISHSLEKKRKEFVSQVLMNFYNTDIKDFQNAVSYFDTISDSKNVSFLSTLFQNQSKGVYSRDRSLSKEHFKHLTSLVKEHYASSIRYNGIGVEDSKVTKGNRVKEYLSLVEQGVVLPVSVKKIMTMDVPALCPAQYNRIASGIHNVKCSPVVSDFNVTLKYISFLKDVARVTGVNPNQVSVVNMGRILDSNLYLDPSTY